MSRVRMHDDEILTDAGLLRRLLAEQFPQWAGLPVRPVASYGTDHDIYRLGDELVARLPRIGWAAGQAGREAYWLPRLAPHLPLRLPVPVALGRPGAGYPYPWSVVAWLPGDDANGTLDDLDAAAADLAGFVRALRAIDPAGAPPGRELAASDAAVRAAVTRLGDRADGPAILRCWDDALAAPAHPGPGVWVHGDLLPGNLLVTGGRLSAVIDFGGLSAGDPAGDLIPAWNSFAGRGHDRFRAGLGPDDAAWRRGRGWALRQAVEALPYYWDTNPGMVRQARRTLAALLTPA